MKKDVEKFKRIFSKFTKCLFNLEYSEEAYKVVNKFYLYLLNKYKNFYDTHPDFFYQLTHYISVYNDKVRDN